MRELAKTMSLKVQQYNLVAFYLYKNDFFVGEHAHGVHRDAKDMLEQDLAIPVNMDNSVFSLVDECQKHECVIEGRIQV